MTEGRLSVCGTPIGNLGDVSERLIQILSEADVVYAEDTRRTSKLLSHVGVKPRLRSLFVGNERERTADLLSDISSGQRVVLVSDAGMPTVSDPGANAIREAREAGFLVTVVPGPSAVTTAVTASGFEGDRFVFEGFLPRKGKVREARLAGISTEERTVVLFASPHRLAGDLEDLLRVLGGGRQVAVARELTKLHEEVWVGSLNDAIERWSGDVKGEVTVVIEAGAPLVVSDREAVGQAVARVAAGMSRSDAARETAVSTGVSRKVIYEALLKDQDSI